MNSYAMQVDEISRKYLPETSLIRKSTSSCIKNRFQKFVQMKFYVETIFDDFVLFSSREKYWSASVILDSPMISIHITFLYSNQVSYFNREDHTRRIDP